MEEIVPEYVDEKQRPEEWDLKGLDERILRSFTLKLNLAEQGCGDDAGRHPGDDRDGSQDASRNKEKEYGTPLMDYLMKVIMLQAIDSHWKEHLLAMDHLKEGIGLRGYGQKDPVREYQKEGYNMFMEMIARVKEDSSKSFAWSRSGVKRKWNRSRRSGDRITSCRGGRTPRRRSTVKRDAAKVGRNDPCPCGSGKKYKKCCGQ